MSRDTARIHHPTGKDLIVPKKTTTETSTRRSSRGKRASIGAKLIGDARQRLQPQEFRISDAPPTGEEELLAGDALPAAAKTKRPGRPQVRKSDKPQKTETESVLPPPPPQPAVTVRLLCEIANCLWHVKTQHFRRKWTDEDTADEDPRTRRTLGRLNRGIAALQENGIVVIDMTGERYASGAEGFMRPLEFLPTPGITVEIVSEMVRPIVLLGQQVVQGGEGFVSVPAAPSAVPASPELPPRTAAAPPTDTDRPSEASP
jgi:hypothetical protein